MKKLIALVAALTFVAAPLAFADDAAPAAASTTAASTTAAAPAPAKKHCKHCKHRKNKAAATDSNTTAPAATTAQ